MNNISSVLFYLFIFSLSTYLIYKGSVSTSRSKQLQIFRKRIHVNYWIVFGLLIPMVLGFLRYGIGVDYAAYLEIYQYHAQGIVINDNANYAESIEQLYWWLAKLSYALTASPMLFFGIPWSATVLFAYFGMRRLGTFMSPERMALTWFTLLSIATPLGFNQIRQTLAVSILFFAASYIIKADKKSAFTYFILGALAFLCHHTSILFSIPMYFIGRLITSVEREKNFKKINLAVLGLGIILVVIFVIFAMAIKGVAEDYSHFKYVRELYRLLFIGEGQGFIDLRPDNLILFTVFTWPIMAHIRYRKIVSRAALKLVLVFCYIGAALLFMSLFVMNGERLAQYFVFFAPMAVFGLASNSTRHRLLAYPLTVFSMIMFFGWQSPTQYNIILNRGHAELNAISNRRVRSLFDQSLCITKIKSCKDFNYKDAIPDKSRYEYKSGDLWGFE